MAVGSRKLVPDVSALGQVRLWSRRTRPESTPGAAAGHGLGPAEDASADAGARGGSAAASLTPKAGAGVSRQNPAQPRAHADTLVVEAKLARIDEPHVAPLNDLVREINGERQGGFTTPWFDPDGAGVDARVLLLFESPGAGCSGERGSGIVSADNDDPASAMLFALREEAGLARDAVVAWNAVPWPVTSSAGKPRSTVAADLAEAEPWLRRLVALLPELRLAVTFGTSARDGWLRLLTTHRDAPLVPTLAVAQTSPNAVRVGDSRARILLALSRAAEVSG
jgi:hypothetical protein